VAELIEAATKRRQRANYLFTLETEAKNGDRVALGPAEELLSDVAGIASYADVNQKCCERLISRQQMPGKSGESKRSNQ
jgi:hypothetical protein